MALQTVGELITALRFLPRDMPLRVFLDPNCRTEVAAGIELTRTKVLSFDDSGVPDIGDAAALIVDINSRIRNAGELGADAGDSTAA